MREGRRVLEDWIAPPDISVNYNAACEAHHEGTASWCTEDTEGTKGTKGVFAEWKKASGDSGSLLWIHGKRTYPATLWVLIVADDTFDS